MSRTIIPNTTYSLAFKAAQSHTISSSLPWLPQTEQGHHSFTVPPHTTVAPAPCSLPPRFCMELLSISQSRCSSVSHCLTEEQVIAHWLLRGNTHGCAWILCNTLWGLLYALEIIYSLHMYPVTQLPGYFRWSVCYMISQMKFRWFRPPDSRKKELHLGNLFALEAGALSR